MASNIFLAFDVCLSAHLTCEQARLNLDVCLSCKTLRNRNPAFYLSKMDAQSSIDPRAVPRFIVAAPLLHRLEMKTAKTSQPVV
ncbi:hypothetical protein Ddc_11950 [Ditylenchus destructor]|nr:hypothetical protein Ddc_11950 [Ditylenchus destructor]